MKVEKIEVHGSWKRVYDAALTTVGKTSDKQPTNTWKKRMLLAEHSPIRLLEYDVVISNVPYYVIMHLVRHHVGIEKFVITQRDDRTNNSLPRDQKPQGALVSCMFSMNAQAIMTISTKRMCMKASPETRKCWGVILEAIKEIDPVLVEKCVPECVYRGFCPEFTCCGYINAEKTNEKLYEYRSVISNNRY